MEYTKATEKDAAALHRLIKETIQTVYPRYYPREIVNFFCALHGEESILGDIKNGNVFLLSINGKLCGTGSRRGNHITRVYVTPTFQNRGCGSLIMNQLEQEIAETYPTSKLDASLPACRFYEHRGYQTIKHENLPVENGAVLVYEIMEKKLK